MCIDDKFSKSVPFYRGKNAINKFIEAILEECNNCKKVIKSQFNKILVMSEENGERSQSSNKCWICHKLFNVGGNRVRDHFHVTGEYRSSAY